MLTTLRNLIGRTFGRSTRAKSATRPACRPTLEGLEDRMVPVLPTSMVGLLNQGQQAINALYSSPRSPNLSLGQVHELRDYGANYVNTLRNPYLSDSLGAYQSTRSAAAQLPFMRALGQVAQQRGSAMTAHDLAFLPNEVNRNTMVRGGMGHVANMTSLQGFQGVRNDPVVNAAIIANPESLYYGGPAPAIQDRVNAMINALPGTRGSQIDLVGTARLAGLDGRPNPDGRYNLVPTFQTVASPGAAFVQQGGPNVALGTAAGLAPLLAGANLGGLGFTNLFGGLSQGRTTYAAPQPYRPTQAFATPFSAGVSYVPFAPGSPFGMYRI